MSVRTTGQPPRTRAARRQLSSKDIREPMSLQNPQWPTAADPHTELSACERNMEQLLSRGGVYVNVNERL